MKEEILAHLNDPRQLEKIYRSNKPLFKREFNLLYPELEGNPIAQFWNERLNHENEDISWGTKNELIFVIVTCAIAGLIAKLPKILSINEEAFYTKNIGFIIFPLLSTYFSWKNKLSLKKIVCIAALTLAGLIFINTVPFPKKSDSLVLSSIHIILFLWSITGFAFIGTIRNDEVNRLGYLKFNGDFIVMTILILISGALLTAITLGLFSLIGFHIEQFYFDYVGIFGLSSAPLIATYLTRTNPQLVGKVSPVIAKIFSPLVLVMLVVYLIAMIYSRKDPYNDREFLMVFNALLIGVMALIFFSVAETSRTPKSRSEMVILFLLSVITVIVNGIALSAIVFRIAEWGITPNRTAILGGNVLILINLLLVTAQLVRVISKKSGLDGVVKIISSYLPVYFLWTIIVTFVFPFIFHLN